MSSEKAAKMNVPSLEQMLSALTTDGCQLSIRSPNAAYSYSTNWVTNLTIASSDASSRLEINGSADNPFDAVAQVYTKRRVLMEASQMQREFAPALEYRQVSEFEANY